MLLSIVGCGTACGYRYGGVVHVALTERRADIITIETVKKIKEKKQQEQVKPMIGLVSTKEDEHGRKVYDGGIDVKYT
jgi:hypothetical protein